MKKIKVIIAGLIVASLLAGCGQQTNGTTGTPTPTNTTTPDNNNNNTNNDVSVTPEPTKTPSDDVQDPEQGVTDPAGDLSVEVESDSANACTKNGNVFTIRAAGTYTFTGTASEGYILVDAGEDAEVNIVLAGCKISCSTNSPIYVESAKSVKIKSESDTTNQILDLRQAATEEEAADAAIYAKCDLSLTGKGTLIVKSTCNNGIQTKDTLSIKNVTLKVESVNNALKGNKAVEIESGEILLVSTGGDGIKTSDTSLTKKGNQRGSVIIAGGNITIYAKYDGIDAAYDIQIDTEGKISVYNGKYSSYTSASAEDTDSESGVVATGWWGGGFGGGNQSNKNTPSAKALKAGNAIIINNGELVLKTEDDGIHAGTDDAFESGAKSTGEVTINGGTITITSGDDGIHGDGVVNFNNGNVSVTTSYEGIEGNVINMNGGNVVVTATDDGVNACKGSYSNTPLVNITGGYLEVTTSSGDTDGIDSNGNITMSGGVVVVKGGSSQGNVAGSVDVDGKITITGGTLLALGGICELPTNSQNTYASNSTSFTSGTYTVKNASGKEIVSVTVSASYKGFWICSDSLTTGESFTLYKADTSVLNWTQTKGTMGSTGSTGGWGGPGRK